jgi:hypothetical protein
MVVPGTVCTTRYLAGAWPGNHRHHERRGGGRDPWTFALSHSVPSNEGQGTERSISCIIAESFLFGAIGDMI